ncbi:hypothetical protein EOL94_01735 [bacterium]|nr:hypothetical protein [bacterium]
MENSIEKTEEILKILSKRNDINNSYLLYKKIKSFLDKNKTLKTEDRIRYKRLERCMFKAQFLSLNYFDDWTEIADLIKNNFVLVFSLPEYDFWSKIKSNLLYLEEIKQRDEIKEKLKEALFKCSNKIVDSEKYNEEIIEKVYDWMKHFVANFGPGKIDKVKKTEYLNNNKEIKKLKPMDRDKVFALLNFYERLLFSSFEPEGMEETVLYSDGEKEYILSRQGLEDLEVAERKLKSLINLEEESDLEVKQNDNGLDYFNKTEEDDNDKNFDLGSDFDSDSENYEGGEIDEIKELQKKAMEYNINSLEFKVLQEEIKKRQGNK